MNCSLYLHIPFCKSRCNYCDFNTFAGRENFIKEYIRSLCVELDHVSRNIKIPQSIHTVYFGGGTPSLLIPDDLQTILQTIHSTYLLLPDCEITLEANPGTLNENKLIGYRESGVNRISLGVQSLSPGELTMLGRIHSAQDVYHSYQIARQSGFENISADIIFGIPGQTLESLHETVQPLAGLGFNHISAYGLTVEPGTPLALSIASGKLQACEDDLMADMYEALEDWLCVAGYDQYEISNWSLVSSQKDYRCKHNLQYWHNEPWLGFGAGAASFFMNKHFSNVTAIEDYIQKMRQKDSCQPNPFPAIDVLETISLDQEMDETMMLGMRLTREGVSRKRFCDRFKVDFAQLYGADIEYLIRIGLAAFCKENGGVLRLTRRGRILGNQVFMRFLREDSDIN